MINQNDDDLLIKLRRSFASKGFGCILTNDCDSDDEDFGPNGYLFYVKIAVESEKKVRSGLWVAQLKSPADRFEFIGETITEKSAEKIPKMKGKSTNKKDKTAKWTIHQEKRHA
uniref:Uncharacterized protein n=1 Tax=Globodera pallida TaxID=36090 RepID=A0A183CBX0_GLOPA